MHPEPGKRPAYGRRFRWKTSRLYAGAETRERGSIRHRAVWEDDMNVEIERKFLVKSEAWRGLAEGVRFRQGYLQTHPCTVRVRTEGERGVLTIKGQTRGFSREEFEYEIPRGDADRMLDTLALPSLIDKIRYKIPYQGFVWEVDEFLGDNAGLVVAEIELSDEGQAFERPGWIGEEVTGDRRYANSALASRPFCMW